MPGQFVNPANPRPTIETTGPEIWEDTDGQVDFFVAGVGTGGTVTGVGQYLKSKEPRRQGGGRGARLLPRAVQGVAGAHKIQGIGAGFVPDVLDTKVYDEIIPVDNDDAFAAGKGMGRTRGRAGGYLLRRGAVGGHRAGQAPGKRGQDHRGLLPDTGDRYLSTPLFAD